MDTDQLTLPQRAFAILLWPFLIVADIIRLIFVIFVFIGIATLFAAMWVRAIIDSQSSDPWA